MKNLYDCEIFVFIFVKFKEQMKIYINIMILCELIGICNECGVSKYFCIVI